MTDNNEYTEPDIKLEKQFINNLPEHYQQYQNVDALFHALGKYFDELRNAINQFQYYNDWAVNNEDNLTYLAEQYGASLPANLSKERKEAIVRDIITFYRKFGTEPAIKLIFRLAGLEIEIESIFIDSNIQSEDYIYPSDYFFGEDYIDSKGFFKASLTDQSGNNYDNVGIHGEDYPQNELNEVDFIAIRTPYIRVTIIEENYEVFIEDYVSDDGIQYSYSDREKFQIVQNLIDYFWDFGRPANVAIIELRTVNTKTIEFDPLKYTDESLNIDEKPNDSLTIYDIHYDHFAYLDVDVDVFTSGYTVKDLVYDTYNDVLITSDPEEQNIQREYSSDIEGLQLHFPLRQNTEISISGPSELNIELQVSNEPKYKIIDNIDEELIGEETSNLFSVYETITEPKTVQLNGYLTGRLNILEKHGSDIHLYVRYLKSNIGEEVYDQNN